MKGLKHIVLSMAGLCVGCATQVAPPTVHTNSTDIALMEAASSIHASLQALAELESSAVAVEHDRTSPHDYGMGELISVEWNGPIAGLLQEMGRITHYKVEVVGREPALPVLVHVHAKHAMIGDVIADVHAQARSRADIVIYPEEKLMELHYNG